MSHLGEENLIAYFPILCCWLAWLLIESRSFFPILLLLLLPLVVCPNFKRILFHKLLRARALLGCTIRTSWLTHERPPDRSIKIEQKHFFFNLSSRELCTQLLWLLVSRWDHKTSNEEKTERKGNIVHKTKTERSRKIHEIYIIFISQHDPMSFLVRPIPTSSVFFVFRH